MDGESLPPELHSAVLEALDAEAESARDGSIRSQARRARILTTTRSVLDAWRSGTLGVDEAVARLNAARVETA